MNKRWILLPLSVLLLSGGCREAPPVRLTLPQEPMKWEWTQGDLHFSGTLQRLSPDSREIVFEEPKTLSGLSCRLDPEETGYALQGLLCRFSESALPPGGLPAMLCEWAAQMEEDPPVLQPEEDGCACEGAFGSGRFSLQADADGTGKCVCFVF